MNQHLRLSLFLGAAGAASFALSACISGGQQQAALDTVKVMEESGLFKEEVVRQLRTGLEAAGRADFWQQAIGSVFSIALSYLGVRVGRGPTATVEERIGRRLARKRR